jgi:hypothetical protein
MRNLISGVFPDWTDDNVANFGNTLVELWCFVGDVLTKRQDNAARESRWSTASQLKSILAMVKMIDYTPSGQTAAQATETFTLAGPAAGTVTIPKGTQVGTLDPQNPIFYQLLADLLIPIGVTQESATVENSQFAEDVLDSTGQLSQAFTLTKSPFLDETETVIAGNGIYARVDNFLSSQSTDRHYTVKTDSQGRATFTFGNGVSGAVPVGQIVVDYKYGGGTAGRVDQNTLRALQGQFTDSLGNPVQVTCTNPLASSTPQDRETVAHIQATAPLAVRVAGRAIARDDFEIVALQVPGVSRALYVTRNEDPSVPFNAGFLFLVPPGATVASDGLIAAVKAAFVTTPYGNTLDLTIQAAQYLVVDVTVTAYKQKGTTPAQLKASVTTSLTNLFADTIAALNADGTANKDAGKPNPLINFGYYLQDVNGMPGGTLDWADVFDTVQRSPGVRKVDAGPVGLLLNGERADLSLETRQFPKLGAVVVIDGDTGVQL